MKKQNPVISSMTCWTIPQNCRRFDRVLTFLTSIYRESKVGQVRTVLKVHLSLYACVCVSAVFSSTFRVPSERFRRRLFYGSWYGDTMLTIFTWNIYYSNYGCATIDRYWYHVFLFVSFATWHESSKVVQGLGGDVMFGYVWCFASWYIYHNP